MNKKIILTLLVGIMALALVSAGVMAYYGQVNSKINVIQPISFTVDGEEYTGKSFADNIECDAGDTCLSTQNFKISNSASESRTVKISEYDSPEGVEAIYRVCVPDSCGDIWVCVSEPIPVNNIITIAPECEASFDISYRLDSMLTDETYTVKTRVSPVDSL